MQLPNNAISTTDAARIIGIHPISLRQLMRQGKIKGVKIKKYWYVDIDSLKDYINRNGSHRENEVEINIEHAIRLVDFAESVEIHPNTLRQYIRSGKLRATNLNGVLFVTDSEIARFKSRFNTYKGKKILSLQEAVEQLDCSLTAINRYIKRGEIKRVKIEGKVFVYADSLERFKERLSAGKHFLQIPKGRIRRAAVIERQLMELESGEKWDNND